MITGITKSGFAFAVSEKIGNDYRVLDAIVRFQSGKDDAVLSAMMELPRLILSDAGFERLVEHVREEDGVVPTDRIMAEITEIIQLSKDNNEELKKS